jgi:hypothetical protein
VQKNLQKGLSSSLTLCYKAAPKHGATPDTV